MTWRPPARLRTGRGSVEADVELLVSCSAAKRGFNGGPLVSGGRRFFPNGFREWTAWLKAIVCKLCLRFVLPSIGINRSWEAKEDRWGTAIIALIADGAGARPLLLFMLVVALSAGM